MTRRPISPRARRTPLRRTVVAASALAMLWASSASAGRAGNQIRSVDHGERDGATTLRIRGSGTPTFTVYKLDRPSRVVVDVASAALDGRAAGDDGKAAWDVNTWAVGQVTAHTMTGSGGSVVRVVVGLARPGTYNVRAVGNDVVVTVTPRDRQPAGADRADVERARADV
jgi:hypothetical protein